MIGETSYYYPCALFCRDKFRQGAFGHVVYAEAEYLHRAVRYAPAEAAGYLALYPDVTQRFVAAVPDAVGDRRRQASRP